LKKEALLTEELDNRLENLKIQLEVGWNVIEARWKLH
jgi:hypothetical protein